MNNIPENIRQGITRAVAQISFFDCAMNLGVFSSEKHRQKWTEDLEVLLFHHALHAVRLELLDEGNNVLFCFRVEFKPQPPSGPVIDSAGALELPLIDCAPIRQNRLVVEYNEVDRASYSSLLQLRWADCEDLQEVDGSQFISDHIGKSTAGNQHGSFFVGNGARRSLVVTRTGTKDYIFAETVDEPKIAGIFIHRRWLSQDCALQTGARVNGLLVTTPDGIQARDVRAA